MERQIPITIVTTTPSDNDEYSIILDDSLEEGNVDDENDDIYSIEELENAVFSEPEEDSDVENIKIFEPDDTDYEEIVREESQKEEQTSELEERVIPISLESGVVLMPKFKHLEDLKPPKWSIFHQSGRERTRKVSLTSVSSKRRSQSGSKSSSQQSHNSSLRTRKYSLESVSSKKENEIGKILDEIKLLGKLPLSSQSSMDDSSRESDFSTFEEMRENFQHFQKKHFVPSQSSLCDQEDDGNSIKIPIFVETGVKNNTKVRESENSCKTGCESKSGDDRINSTFTSKGNLSDFLTLRESHFKNNEQNLKSCLKSSIKNTAKNAECHKSKGDMKWKNAATQTERGNSCKLM